MEQFIIVAIMTWTGYNQEDSIIVSKDCMERGLFKHTVYKLVNPAKKYTENLGG